ETVTVILAAVQRARWGGEMAGTRGFAAALEACDGGGLVRQRLRFRRCGGWRRFGADGPATLHCARRKGGPPPPFAHSGGLKPPSHFETTRHIGQTARRAWHAAGETRIHTGRRGRPVGLCDRRDGLRPADRRPGCSRTGARPA